MAQSVTPAAICHIDREELVGGPHPKKINQKKWRMGREPLSAIITYRLEFYDLAFPRVSG